MLVGGGIVALEPRCLNAFMFVKCFANSAEYRSPAKFQLIVARLSSPRRTPRTWIQIHSACRRMEMDFMNIPEQNELPPPFHSFHPTIRCLELILFCRILSNTRRNDEENIMIRLPSFWRKYRKMARVCKRSNRYTLNRPAKSQEVS